ncbi:MAG TPA: molecular chaperone DnaK, partial [Planctomycetaceae bacterium]|nr:molecular chaperone DnaK [Planctomycetaceae bacterium]
ARNAADTLIYTSEKTLREHGEKIPPAVRSEVEEKLRALRETREKKADDIAALKSATEALAQAAQKMGQALYRTGAAGQEQEDKTASQTGKGETVEGEAREGGAKEEKENNP